MLAQAEGRFVVRVPLPPPHTGLCPVLEPLLLRSWLAEELHLHLLKFAGTEDELLGRYLVTERLSLLRDTERNLHRHRLLHVQELNEHRLRCLWAKVDGARFYSLIELLSKLGSRELLIVDLVKEVIEGIDRADRCLEHQVKLALIRELRASTVRAYVATGANGASNLLAACLAALHPVDSATGLHLRCFVSAEALLTVETVNERVGETSQVSTRFPDAWVHHD
jgi:hypothetical protein